MDLSYCYVYKKWRCISGFFNFAKIIFLALRWYKFMPFWLDRYLRDSMRRSLFEVNRHRSRHLHDEISIVFLVYLKHLKWHNHFYYIFYIWAATWDFQHCGSLTSVDSDEPVQLPFKLRNSKWCSGSSLTLICYSSDEQRLWSDCAYAQADLRLCWSHIRHWWKSHVAAHICFDSLSGTELKVSLNVIFSGNPIGHSMTMM